MRKWKGRLKKTERRDISLWRTKSVFFSYFSALVHNCIGTKRVKQVSHSISHNSTVTITLQLQFPSQVLLWILLTTTACLESDWILHTSCRSHKACVWSNTYWGKVQQFLSCIRKYGGKWTVHIHIQDCVYSSEKHLYVSDCSFPLLCMLLHYCYFCKLLLLPLQEFIYNFTSSASIPPSTCLRSPRTSYHHSPVSAVLSLVSPGKVRPYTPDSHCTFTLYLKVFLWFWNYYFLGTHHLFPWKTVIVDFQHRT